jgi:acetyl esterase/lipase
MYRPAGHSIERSLSDGAALPAAGGFVAPGAGGGDDYGLCHIPCRVEGFEQHGRRLGAGNGVAAAEEKERNARHPYLLRPPLVAPDLAAELVAMEHGPSLLGVDARVGDDPDQRFPIPDGLAFGQVRRQQSLLDVTLDPPVGGQVQQAVGVEGIAGFRLFQLKRQPILGRQACDMGLAGGGLLPSHAVFRGQAGSRVALDAARRPGIELETVPFDLDVCGMVEGPQGGFEASLADVAPGANHVRPDFNLHATENAPCGGSIPTRVARVARVASAGALRSAAVSRRRLEYGRRRGQCGDLWVPDGTVGAGGGAGGGPPAKVGRPVVVLLHGGFWKAMYTKSLMTNLAADIIDRGWVAWNLEYRRVGSIPSGGWPGTFEDVGAGIDYLRTLADGGEGGIDLTRVIAVGHSAGGHLALWAAGRSKLLSGAPGAPSANSVLLRGAVGLAPVCDLSEGERLGLGGGAVSRLLGGSPQRHPERYAVADPAALLPIGVTQVLVHGDGDGAVPLSLSRGYVAKAVAAGDRASLVELPGCGHMELIDPASSAWGVTILQIRRLLA